MSSTRLALILLAGCCAILAGAGLRADAAEPRYQAAFVDGERAEGARLVHWHDNGATPKLDSTPLSGEGVELRWLRDVSLDEEPLSLNAGFVEMIGGDRLPGRVLGYQGGQAGYLPDSYPHGQLLVQPSTMLHFPLRQPLEEARVLVREVARVVWGKSRQRELKPGTLFYQDGRTVTFRSLRWEGSAVQVLLEEGPRRVEFHELAEVHLPRSDAWDAYYRELALLAPDGQARLVRLETTDGVIATASEPRMRAATLGSDSDANTWYHMVQPAWSLDPLWLRFATIHSRLYFAPHEVPLTRLRPAEVMQKPLLGGGWHWRAGENVQGGPLRNAGQYHGWGMGVHALCELVYDLPATARSFRTKMGLDQVVGSGGCVRAKVFLNNSQGEPLYQSEHLIGSTNQADTGQLALASPDSGRFRLILHADPAHDDRPEGADPLDIRDALDWLEPMLLLDEEALQGELRRRAPVWVPAWDGWQVQGQAEDDFQLVNHWQTEGSLDWVYDVGALPASGRLVLSRKIEIPADADWLLVAVRRVGSGGSSMLVVRVDGEQVFETEIPAGPPGAVNPISVPTTAYQKREVEIELEQRAADGKPAPVVWSAISFEQELPTIARLFEDHPRQFNPRPSGDGPVQLSASDPYSGSGSVKVLPGADGLQIGPMKLAVRERPLVGEYRYLRFAVRMHGNVRAALELGHARRNERAFRYDAGMGPPALEGAVRVNNSVPPQWIVITRDLFADFGAFDLTDLALQAVGDGECLFDHIYLGRTPADFNQIGAQGKLTPQQASARAAVADFQGALDLAQQALVLLNVEGHHGTGVLISPEGLIATTGYAAVNNDKPVEVTLHDGRKVMGKTLGIHREADAALVQLEDEGPWPHLLTDSWNNADGRLMALAYMGQPQQRKLGAAIVNFHGAERNGVWISLAYERSFSGAPLVNHAGKLVGLLSRPFGPGGTIAVPIGDLQQARDRLVKGETWGRWPAAAAPLVGFQASREGDKLEVIAVRPGGPAAQAGIEVGDQLDKLAGQEVRDLQGLLNVVSERMPGETLSVELVRNGETLTKQITAGRR